MTAGQPSDFTTASDQRSGWLAAMPLVFVLIWSTGFIVARYGMPHAPPLSFLALRFGLSVLCFGAWILWAGIALPRSPVQWFHLGITGLLMHGIYLGGVWAAVKLGLGAGTTALIVGLQPLLTALWLSRQSSASPESARTAVTLAQWSGLLLGLLGMGLVVQHKLGSGEGTLMNVSLALAALLGITTGTLYQKRFVTSCDVRAASFVQLSVAGLAMWPLAVMESEPVRWHPQLMGALAWSVLALTVGASSMLYLLIQRGAATRVTSLLYLVPPCTAVMGWWLFDEIFTVWMAAGIALSVAGVVLVTRSSSAVASPPRTGPGN